MIESGAAFARKFKQDDPVLDKIDKDLLGRKNGGFTPGGWCSDSPKCSKVGDLNSIKPGPGADRFKRLIARMEKDSKFCRQARQHFIRRFLSKKRIWLPELQSQLHYCQELKDRFTAFEFEVGIPKID
ncbi:hypothetical protein GH714_009824 [Hevea brasiliensis]|uniref:Uncharacterized protein n=1 Tax=Hevea brasiliensis TaxID=3981 RepID=A0A6A6KD36_HEVBR|nr:hypothetical protein GH714_009824 [Hevea brasiliensis]